MEREPSISIDDEFDLYDKWMQESQESQPFNALEQEENCKVLLDSKSIFDCSDARKKCPKDSLPIRSKPKAAALKRDTRKSGQIFKAPKDIRPDPEIVKVLQQELKDQVQVQEKQIKVMANERILELKKIELENLKKEELRLQEKEQEELRLKKLEASYQIAEQKFELKKKVAQKVD
jgi:TolA-binding protein